MRQIVVITHNLRSTHNIGSLLRTADGLGVHRLYFTGYTPYPIVKSDTRMPHEAKKIDAQIHKTALGAEHTIEWKHVDAIEPLLEELRSDNYTIAALEQSKNSVKLPDFQPPDKLAIILGREVEGLETDLLKACDLCLEIPMHGKKESFNVVQAAAMCLYHCTYYPF